jgi:hypothetical protein
VAADSGKGVVFAKNRRAVLVVSLRTGLDGKLGISIATVVVSHT